MAEMSKTAKAATKKAIVNLNVPQCCGKPMQAAKMMTSTGRVRGMMCMQTQAQRGILEFSYKYPGMYMFHAHVTEFAELGWNGMFEVTA